MALIQIPLKGIDRPLVLDDADVPVLQGRTPFVRFKGGQKWPYAAVKIGGRTRDVHRLVARAVTPPDLLVGLPGVEKLPRVIVDHRDGNTLNCCRSNLRICGDLENSRNQKKRTGGTSKYRGVSWDGARQKWAAQIQGPKGRVSLGRHDTEEEAALAFDAACRKRFGKYGRFNFPLAGEESALVAK